MSDEYAKVGTIFYLPFYYQNSVTGAPVTGAVSGDFTLQISKNGVGNQSTTGTTISEIDATNQPGSYLITCAANSFVAATGSYEVKIFLTADTTVAWTMTVRVTSDGTGAGTWGAASFTATAANGRVMVGATPLEGATLYIVYANGTVYLEETSDSSGLWGPVWFPANGTYTVYVQKSGYTTTSGTITVSGSTATGPGTDLTVAVSSTTSTVLVSTLLGYLSRQFIDATGTQFLTIGLEVINEAAEMLSMERQWPYYESYGGIQIQPAYTTGTVTLTNGSATATFSSATLPTWAASGQIFVSGVWVPVSTRDSSSQVTLAYAWGGDTVTSAFTLAQIRYALPVDCARIDRFMQGSQSAFLGEHTSAAQIEALKDAWGDQSPGVVYWAVEKNFLVIYPLPQNEQHINLLYYRKPAQVTSGSDTLDWDAGQNLVLRRALDYIAAARGATVYGSDGEARANAVRAAKQAYEAALEVAWSWDKTAANPPSVPYAPIDLLRGNVTS